MISAVVNIVSFVNSVFGKLKERSIKKVLLVAGCWLLVTGTFSYGQPNYYSKPAGNLDVLSTWRQNTNGTGAAPPNFTSANKVFNIRNTGTTSIGANCTVSGDPVLSATVNTTILISYGNPQITDDLSVKTVWKSSYQGVWHMGDNPVVTAPQLKYAAQSNDGTHTITNTYQGECPFI